MNEIQIFGIIVPIWFTLPIVYFVWVSFFLFVKNITFRVLKKFTDKTATKLDDIFIAAADFPIVLLIITSGGAVVERLLPIATNIELTNYLLIGFKATTIIAIILFVDRFLTALIGNYSQKVEILKTSSGIAKGTIRVLVIGLGVLILLDSFGVSITPIIASLGVGSLAVALALQPTLENFFSGVQIIIDKPFQVGHFIKLDSGEEGYVHKIGWRSTWVRMLANNVIAIPNKLMVDSKIVNYYYPERELAVLVQVGVHYNSDLEHVEKVTCEVAKEVLKELPGGVDEFEPFIRYHTFDNSSINFTVILRAKEFVDSYLIKHEFIKQLHKRYNKEGICIPFPIRALNLDQEGAHQLLAELKNNTK
ncbi:MAG: mechanosensitive ion channel family protein [Candidatus Omnitrophica bacterium]|nr:mechanosensitive ion channel family protein [Candidatus Omnitrophota bacterium]